MAITMPKKMSLDVAADVSSADSLSFASLVCINDQLLMSQSGQVVQSSPKNAAGIQEQDPEFEFDYATLGSTASSPKKDSPSNLFPNGQLLPQVVSFPLNHSQVSPRVSFKDLSPPIHRSSRRSSSESGLNKADREPNSEVRNQANKKHGNAGQSFGQKYFRSFANPCKSCHALEPSPSKKVHTLQKGNIKSQ